MLTDANEAVEMFPAGWDATRLRRRRNYWLWLFGISKGFYMTNKNDSTHFTVVFAGDLRKLGKNPFKITSDFGEPVSVAFGDALEELDEYRDEAVAVSNGDRGT